MPQFTFETTLEIDLTITADITLPISGTKDEPPSGYIVDDLVIDPPMKLSVEQLDDLRELAIANWIIEQDESEEELDNEVPS